MLRLKPLDEKFPIQTQLDDRQSPVVLINVFAVDARDEDGLMRAWQADANWMKSQPGYISTQLHRAVGAGTLYLNYAVWESVAHFRAAFSNPEFRSALANYPDSVTASPHLFRRLAVANLCTA
jgi:heme-degrading monooxygenase HmoA